MTRRIRMVSVGTCAFALGMLALRDTRLEAQSGADVQRAVDSAYEKFKTRHEGKNADYIPALAKVDSVRAQRAITAISNALGGNPYAKKAGG